MEEEFKRTRGKWVLKEQGDANEYCILNDKMKWVAAFKLNGEQGREEQMANMNLFTAAPELLSALQAILKHAEFLINENHPDYKKAKSAINRALGL